MHLDEYAFGIHHYFPSLRAPPLLGGEIAGHGDTALQW